MPLSTGRFAVAACGVLVTLAFPAATVVASGIQAAAPPCHVVARAPDHVGGAPGKTVATMTFTCIHSHARAVARVQSQQLIRGRWIHQATRTVTTFQVTGGRRYKTTTPPIDCSPGQYRTIASVKTGSRTIRAKSPTVSITCAKT
jgi:hypothetical protein